MSCDIAQACSCKDQPQASTSSRTDNLGADNAQTGERKLCNKCHEAAAEVPAALLGVCYCIAK